MNEYETEEKKKFQITRGMVLLAIISLIIVIVITFIIVNKVRSKKPEYTTSDFQKLESRMVEEAPTYLSQKKIELTSEEIKIDLKDLLIENGGSIDSSKVKAAKICDGYVLASKIDTEKYASFIKCKNLYTTSGYISDIKVTTTKSSTTKKDVEKPVITVIGEKELTVNLGSDYQDAGAKAMDNIDGDITSKIIVSGNVDTSKIGSYVITYTVSDKQGNKATEKRKVTVVASATTTTIKKTTKKSNTASNTTKPKITTTKKITTPPTITLRGSSYITINVGEAWVDPGFIAVDARGNDITSSVTKQGTVNTQVAGTYRITYFAVDTYGNRASKTRTVVVKSSYIKLQSISLTPNSFTLYVGGSKTLTVNYSPSNATNKTITWSSSNPSVASVSNGTIRALKSGVTYITAKAADGASATVSVTVK